MKKDKIKENIINLIGEAGGVDDFVYISNGALTIESGQAPKEVKVALEELVADGVVEIYDKESKNGAIFHLYKLKKFLYC